MNDQQENIVAIAITELAAKIEILLDKQEELAENVSKIKEAVYNPDEGLYARLRTLEIRIDNLDSWKDNNMRILWIVATSVVGLSIATIWRVLF